MLLLHIVKTTSLDDLQRQRRERRVPCRRQRIWSGTVRIYNYVYSESHFQCSFSFAPHLIFWLTFSFHSVVESERLLLLAIFEVDGHKMNYEAVAERVNTTNFGT